MSRPLAIFGCLVLGALSAWPAAGADWRPVRKEEGTSLSVDSASIRRKGDQVSFNYLLDYAKMQGYMKTGVFYRSLVIGATIRCKPRTIALGTTEAYSAQAGTGVQVGAAKPSASEARFSPIEKGTSDEELWGHMCAPKGGAKPS